MTRELKIGDRVRVIRNTVNARGPDHVFQLLQPRNLIKIEAINNTTIVYIVQDTQQCIPMEDIEYFNSSDHNFRDLMILTVVPLGTAALARYLYTIVDITRFWSYTTERMQKMNVADFFQSSLIQNVNGVAYTTVVATAAGMCALALVKNVGRAMGQMGDRHRKIKEENRKREMEEKENRRKQLERERQKMEEIQLVEKRDKEKKKIAKKEQKEAGVREILNYIQNPSPPASFLPIDILSLNSYINKVVRFKIDIPDSNTPKVFDLVSNDVRSAKKGDKVLITGVYNNIFLTYEFNGLLRQYVRPSDIEIC